jgi:hypothetical protein
VWAAISVNGRREGGGVILFIGSIILSMVMALYLIWKKKSGDGVQIVSTVVTTVATVFLTFIGIQQMAQAKAEKRRERFQYRGELREAVWHVTELMVSPIGINYLYSLPLQQQKAVADRLVEIFESQSKNPILMDDEECERAWADGLGSARNISLLRRYKTGPEVEKGIRMHFEKIFGAVIKIGQRVEALAAMEREAGGARLQEVDVSTTWLERVLAALLTPVIALLGLYIAHRQAKTDARRLNHELYDRRYKIFMDVAKFVADTLAAGKTSEDAPLEFKRKTIPVRFLFGPEMETYCEGIYKAITGMRSLDRRLDAVYTPEEKQKVAEERDSAWVVLSHELEGIQSRFEPFLRLY